MLTGCSNPNRPTGTVGSKLSPGSNICDATLKSASYNPDTLTCEFEIYTKVSLQVNQQHFQVNVTDADNKLHTYYQGVSGVTIDFGRWFQRQCRCEDYCDSYAEGFRY